MTTTIIMSALDLAAALGDGRATVEAPDAVDYDDGNCVNSGAAWPSFELTIRLGEWSLDVPVWKCAGWGLATNWGGSRRGWAVSDEDGTYRGFRRPRVIETDDEEYMVEIAGGDNLGSDIDLPAGSDIDAAEAAAEAIGDALQAAYDRVDIPEPSLDELDESDVRRPYWIEISRALEIAIGPAVHRIIADGHREDDYEAGGDGVVWLVRGLPTLAGERYETRAQAETAVREELPAVIGDLPYLYTVVVTVDDSVEAGHCRSGTEEAAETIRARRGLDANDEITAEDVLAVMPDSDAARRVCVIAALRQ